MARITVEDCLEQVPNRFELVLLAARRAKQLLKGARPLVESDNKEIVTGLREVAAGTVRLRYNERRAAWRLTDGESEGSLRRPERVARGHPRGDPEGVPRARPQVYP